MYPDVAPLFRPLHRELMRVLRGLSAASWELPTIARAWRVRDVASHLLDGDLRKLAAHRDGHLLSTGAPPSTYGDVVTLINSLNATGVAYAARLSPRLLADLLDVSGEWIAAFIESLDPEGRALFAVAWSGEAESRNWMDTGREYTERWHHQMQIREAVGEPLLLDDPWYAPLLWFSVRALPRAYANVDAPEGTSINFDVDEWSWCVTRADGAWRLSDGAATNPSATVAADRNTAWRLFYNALDPDVAASLVTIRGDRALAQPLIGARSVMV